MSRRKELQKQYSLNRIYREQNRVYHRLSAMSGLSDTAFWFLYALCEEDADGKYTQNQFCKDWYYPKQTVNSAINNLLDEGIITLNVIQGTHNSKAVKLTPKGKKLCRQKIIPSIELEQKSFEGLMAYEQGILHRLMKKQISLLDEEISEVEQNTGI